MIWQLTPTLSLTQRCPGAKRFGVRRQAAAEVKSSTYAMIGVISGSYTIARNAQRPGQPRSNEYWNKIDIVRSFLCMIR